MSMRRTFQRIESDETGVILVEVIVAALLLVIVALGTFKAFDASARSTAEERHRARANALAEADISRMRSMRISDLANLVQTRTVTQDDQRYTVTSRAEYQTDSTGTASCEAGSASADYIKVSSTVTWPSIGTRPPVVSTTLVAPPNGSVSPNSGALAVAVEDAANAGIPAVSLTGSGPSSFSGSTGPTGCVIFGNLLAGNYSVSIAGVASGYVDPDGKPPTAKTASVVSESTNTVVFQYDDPGTIPVTFKTRDYSNTLIAGRTDSIVTFNTGLSVARVFGTIGSSQPTLTATSMFPFTSDYAVYAGNCEGDNPNPLGIDPPPAPLAIASALVPPGGSAPVELYLPALHVNVFNGTGSSSPGSRINGATVRLWDTKCQTGTPAKPTLRTWTTETVPAAGGTAGRILHPGLPFSEYTVCVSGDADTTAGVDNRRVKVAGVISLDEPSDITGGTVLNVYLKGTGNTANASCTVNSPGDV